MLGKKLLPVFVVLYFVAETIAADSSFQYCIVGAGPSGLQMGRHLQEKKRNYVILERGPSVGTFFRKYPVHRRLISINKRFTGVDDAEYNLRHDWHSLLSSDPALRFTNPKYNFSRSFYPHADEMVRYLEHYYKQSELNVQFDSSVAAIDKKKGDSAYTLDIKGSAHVVCRVVLIATGWGVESVPKVDGLIENSVWYGDQPVDPEFYANKSVLVLGSGNAAFETAKSMQDEAAYVHMQSRSPPKLSWETHYVGNVRSSNVGILDNYLLKSQDILRVGPPAELAQDQYKVVRREDGKVCMDDKHRDHIDQLVADTRAQGEEAMETLNHQRHDPEHSLSFTDRVESAERHCYDIIIRCMGFRYDSSIFSKSLALAHKGKLPDTTGEYESTSHPGVYFLGAASQSQDFKWSSGGFIHGFRYNVRALHTMLEAKYHTEAWPSATVRGVAGITAALSRRFNSASCMYQNFDYMMDIVTLESPEDSCTGDGSDTLESTAGRYFEGIPRGYMPALLEKEAPGQHFLMLTMEYDPAFKGHAKTVQNINVFHNYDPASASDSQFLHPKVYLLNAKKEILAVHHVLEDVYTSFKDRILHTRPLHDFLDDILYSWRDEQCRANAKAGCKKGTTCKTKF